MKIEVKDLQLGDEIIIPSGGSYLRMLKVVSKPNVSGRWSVRVRCEADVEVKETERFKWDYKTKTRVPYQSKSTKWEPLSDNYKKRVTVNLAGRNIWLIKRNGEKV